LWKSLLTLQSIPGQSINIGVWLQALNEHQQNILRLLQQQQQRQQQALQLQQQLQQQQRLAQLQAQAQQQVFPGVLARTSK